MKHYILYFTAAVLVFTGFFATGYLYGVVQDQRASHHRYVRQNELELADLKSRIRMMEEMRIRVDIVDHSGLWMVSGGEVD